MNLMNGNISIQRLSEAGLEGAQDPSQRNRAHKKYIAENGLTRL